MVAAASPVGAAAEPANERAGRREGVPPVALELPVRAWLRAWAEAAGDGPSGAPPVASLAALGIPDGVLRRLAAGLVPFAPERARITSVSPAGTGDRAHHHASLADAGEPTPPLFVTFSRLQSAKQLPWLAAHVLRCARGELPAPPVLIGRRRPRGEGDPDLEPVEVISFDPLDPPVAQALLALWVGVAEAAGCAPLAFTADAASVYVERYVDAPRTSAKPAPRGAKVPPAADDEVARDAVARAAALAKLAVEPEFNGLLAERATPPLMLMFPDGELAQPLADHPARAAWDQADPREGDDDGDGDGPRSRPVPAEIAGLDFGDLALAIFAPVRTLGHERPPRGPVEAFE
jgi:hypothetical protein